jgi:hypothetical protein
MDRKLKRLGTSGLLLACLLLAGPAPGHASHEGFDVYEDWTTASTIRSDRWVAVDTTTLEVKREVKGHHLVMGTRREGGTASNVGFAGARHRLTFTNALAIDQIEADLTVQDLALSGCATNPAQPSRVINAIFLNRFNDGSGGPGNMTGDHLVTVNASRSSDSSDPEGVLRLQGAILRCIDPTCSNAFSIPGGVVNLPATVSVGETFTLRVIWDAPNNQFLVGVGDGPDVALVYAAAANQKPAGVAFADIRTQLVAANCTSGPTVTDTMFAVREVRTNASAIIP